MRVVVSVDNQFDAAGRFAGTQVLVEVRNAPPNFTTQIQTFVTFSIVVNPTTEVTIPVNVRIATNSVGEGGGYVFLTAEEVRAFLYESDQLVNGTQFAVEPDSELVANTPRVMRARRFGDLNGDNRVTSADVTVLARWLVYADNPGLRDLMRAPGGIFAHFCEVAANVTLTGTEPTLDDIVFLARWLVGTGPPR